MANLTLTPSSFATPFSLMVQGTTSDAGKTTLVAGLCRVFARKGISVVPFKPQNMALNSAVTEDGGEIGRSQALQAHAAGVDPHTDMNPILLKPNSDTGAQVIVHGKALVNLEASAYQSFKAKALDFALDSHRRLQAAYDLVLVEGAGSPAEINLRKNDIANMGFAEAADCPVILVADIDRGGVFAHLVGTLSLLSQSEQNRVVGFVINRFRGDIRLLEDGLDWLEEQTGKPVLGVLPYLNNLCLDQEDAIDSNQSPAGFHQSPAGSHHSPAGSHHSPAGSHQSPAGLKQTEKGALGTSVSKLTQKARLTIKVPVLPRISNHTDFDVLRLHPQIDLQYVGERGDLSGADLIILPGSKSVCADLRWFKEQGFFEQVQKHLRYGGKLLGICGGYQMLGTDIADPLGIEGPPGAEAGLGLLDIQTELTESKELKQVKGLLLLGGGVRVAGYEIHSGRTSGCATESPLMELQSGPGGSQSNDGQIIGSYVHGLFDHPDALQALLSWAGLENAERLDRNEIREREINRLADMIEANMDWQKFAQATGISVPADLQMAKEEQRVS